jgi:hypothetical protein
VALAGVGLVAALVVVGLLGAAYFRYLGREQARESPPASPLAERRAPPAPRLQADPARDMRALRAWENEVLDGYAWVDRDAGRVRIPIDRAMDLLAERAAGRRGSGAR